MALMAQKTMPHSFWVEVVFAVVYIMNNTPTTIIHDVTPKEKFIEKKPNLSHLKVFGCITYVHVLNEFWFKLDPKTKKCNFIGYYLEQKGCQCYNPTTQTLWVSRNVVFDELSSQYVVGKGAKEYVEADGSAKNTKDVIEWCQ